MSVLRVHHLEHSRSHRILWLLEELGAKYELETYPRTPEFRAPPELRRVHPLGRSPVVTRGDLVLAESGAIIEELLEVLEGGTALRPDAGSADHRRYRFFLHYAEASFMPPVLVRLITQRLKRAKVPFFVKPIAGGIADKIEESYARPELDHHLRFLDAELADREFLVGDGLTGADIQMSYPLEAAKNRRALDEGYPNVLAYLERMRQRPAYARAIEVGGPPTP